MRRRALFFLLATGLALSLWQNYTLSIRLESVQTMLDGVRRRLEATPPSVAESSRPVPVPRVPVSLEGAELRGSTAAAVAILEFGDFTSESSRVFASDTWPQIQRRYVDAGQVLAAFRCFPTSDPQSFRAAQAAACAGQQSRFWPMHDDLFGDRHDLDETDLRRRAARLSLSGPAFISCMKDRAADRVDADQTAGARLGVHTTPTFFIGTLAPNHALLVRMVLSGGQKLSLFTAVLDRLIRADERPHPRGYAP